MTMQIPFRLLLLAFSALLSGSLLVPTAFAAGAGSRTFEGYEFSEAEFAIMKAGVEHAQNGARALAARDWVTAERECRAGYDAFTGVGMPSRGKAVNFYIQIKACMADAFAGQKRWDRACKWYGLNNYVSAIYANPRRACAEYEQQQSVQQDAPASRPAPPQASGYGAAVSGFSGRVRALNSSTDRGSRMANVAQVSEQCDQLWNFRKTNPTARGAADFCMGIVKFEQGEVEEGCQAMWMSARSLDAVRTASMPQSEANNLTTLEQALKGYRSSCASKGFAWPGFTEDWLHKS
ncbi:MAG: hypothetical protein RL299_8 [Pseudomonadota bacterium]|jgi:hypothetical protein